MQSFKLVAKISRELQDAVMEEVKSKISITSWANTISHESEEQAPPFEERKSEPIGPPAQEATSSQENLPVEDERKGGKKPKRRVKSYNLAELVKKHCGFQCESRLKFAPFQYFNQLLNIEL
eukprot:TRINITY_DN861_c0_g2_i1.p1 TRINITY_DN861_c0_g2~~TRINITY_DN861_c0_g2_i1.p1  ORF type:complete len:122 (+),score=15.36 TRINITY_DN861_c0_g2_i1:365-730(+)